MIILDAQATQAERTRLAWSRSIFTLLGVLFIESRVLMGAYSSAALLVVAVGAVAAAMMVASAAGRHRRTPDGGLRRDLDGGLPASVALVGGLIGLGLLLLVLR